MIDYIIGFINKIYDFIPNIKYFLPNYSNILYILGYGWNFKPLYISDDLNLSDRNKNIVIFNLDVNDNDSLDIDISQKKQKFNIFKLFNTLYFLIILSIISFPFITSIIYSFLENDIQYVINNVFQMLFILQYIAGSIYFSKIHIYNILEKNIKKPLIYTFWLYIGFILSFVLSLFNIIMFNLNLDIIVYSDVIIKYPYLWLKIILNIILFTDKFICYLCLFVNMISFLYVKIYFKNKINNFSKKIKLHSLNNYTNIIGSVGEEFFRFKKEYNKMISKLNHIFSFFNITGLLALYFLIKNMTQGIFHIMEITNIILFIVIDGIYIFVISQVNDIIGEIKNSMISIDFITLILNKNDDIKILKNSSETNDIAYNSKISAISSSKTSEALDWIIMKDILNSDWKTFNIFGFSITDSYILHRIATVIITLLITRDISDGISIIQ